MGENGVRGALLAELLVLIFRGGRQGGGAGVRASLLAELYFFMLQVLGKGGGGGREEKGGR